MTTTRRSTPEETKVITLPLFLVTLPRTPKSQEIIRLPSLWHIAIRVEAYRNQNSLTQCQNCQQFGHIWANCKQPPRCLWCGGGHLHKECPEKENAFSTPACCNCRLADGEKPHPANYRGCSHAKEELQKRSYREHPKPQREGCSLLSAPPQASPSRRYSEAAETSSSRNHRQARFRWSHHPQ
jgi:hypothetical protein